MFFHHLLHRYARTAPPVDAPIAHLPTGLLHVLDACHNHSGLRHIAAENLLEKLLLAGVPARALTPLIVALAEHVDISGSHTNKQRWKKLLADHSWVPIVGENRFARCADAFKPDVPHLQEARLSVVATTTTTIRSAPALRTMCAWGLKEHLNWDDVVNEAREVAGEDGRLDGNIDHAERLLKYVESNFTNISNGVDSRDAALKTLQEIKIIPGVAPLEHRKGAKVKTLFKAVEICHARENDVVWASCATALQPYHQLDNAGLQMRPVNAADLALQIETLVRWCGSDSSDAPQCSVDDVVQHLFRAAKRLVRIDGGFSELDTLRSTAWIPSMLPTKCLRLLHPAQVTIQWNHLLYVSSPFLFLRAYTFV